jgi:dTDP-4-amino-4,6-dideoxygalactose transaminase
MSEYRIPFNRPATTGRELEYVSEAIGRGHISGDGEFSRRCHALLQQELGVPKALLTTSCTDALEMAAMLIGAGARDEIIIPSFTFVSAANAFVSRGATPVFIDVRRDTLNLDEGVLETAITERTKAIIVVHYAGVGCEMDQILAIAARHHVLVIEDNAHGLFGKYKGRFLGTFGSLSTLSFHETKNLTCGEGGALLVNDPDYVQRAEIIREKGTDRTRFFRGETDKYTWLDIGSSFLPSDLLAAFLWGQFEQRHSIQDRRRRIWERYAKLLSPWASTNGVRLPAVPSHCEQSYHMFYLLFPSRESRTEAISRLKSQAILAVSHYVPLHDTPMGRTLGRTHGDCSTATEVSQRVLRLPFFLTLTESEQEAVVAAITEG